MTSMCQGSQAQGSEWEMKQRPCIPAFTVPEESDNKQPHSAMPGGDKHSEAEPVRWVDCISQVGEDRSL